MKKGTAKNIIIALLAIVSVALAAVVVLFAVGVLGPKTAEPSEDSSFSSEESEKEEESKEEGEPEEPKGLDFSDLLLKDGDMSKGQVEDVYLPPADSIDVDYSYSVQLQLSGKVLVFWNDEEGNYGEGYLENIDNAVDMIKFSIPAMPDEQLFYFLLANGDVYSYRVGDCVEGSYTATKEDVSNVKRLFIHYPPAKENAGGSWELYALTESNETVWLNGESV